MSIGKAIVDWYEAHGRDLAWRNTADPYKIWISEIILQQTRIVQGAKYYERFIERFPNVFILAEAEQDEVMKYWEGLGYYSRARNLHATAQYVVNELGGRFPNHYSELIKLKGIGPYTSRAIGSFAFANQTGVVDGNVLRVMSRVLSDFSPINDNKTKKYFQKTIDQWVQDVDSAPFNHGIMDIGSTICTPTKPACLICPLEPYCEARKQGTLHLLPIKPKKLKRKTRYFNFYLAFNEKDEIAIRKRPDTGFWGGLWEIPNWEIDAGVWKVKESEWGGEYQGKLKHVFTHFDLMIHVFRIDVETLPISSDIKFISSDKISIFAFSKAVLKIFDQMLK